MPSDFILCFHVFHLFLFTFCSAFIFISLTFSSSFARFACLPTLVSAHTHVRPCSLEELIPPSSLQKAFAWQDIAVQESVSSHSFMVLSHTLFFSKDWKKLKRCPRTALPQFWGMTSSRAGWGMGCHSWVVWMEPTHCQRGAPASYLLKLIQYLMSRCKLRGLERGDLLNSEDFQQAVVKALSQWGWSPVSHTTYYSTSTGSNGLVFW